jgi:hypothetical protein
MPALKNPRHELFCQLIPQGAKNGWSQAEIYRRCGYKATGHSAEVLASNLLKNIEVQQRIAEITGPALKKARVSIESLLDQLETTINDARGDGQHSVVVNALTLSAKLVGLLRDRVEVGGAGAFDGLETSEQVVAALLSDQPAAEALSTLAVLQREIEAYASSHADVIPATEPARPRPNESELSLALLRPKRSSR